MDFINFRVTSCINTVDKGEGIWKEGQILHAIPTVIALMVQMDLSLFPTMMVGHTFFL